MSYHKKLIEVALPLEAINVASVRESYIYKGNPSAVHKWWAQRPFAAARAVLFAQMVDDPSAHPELFPNEEDQRHERERLFQLIREMILWENMTNQELLNQARMEINKYAPSDELPVVLDPFAGGGTIPLESQRLGLEAYASDLNPVAVLINKALIEIPPRFINHPVIHPQSNKQLLEREQQGSLAIAEDIKYYGQWLVHEAEQRIGDLYPKIQLPPQYGGGEATVIAWLWARTVISPNPAADGNKTPLVHSFVISQRKNRKVWVEPVVDQVKLSFQFKVRSGENASHGGTMNKKGAKCLFTGTQIPFDYIRGEGKAGRLDSRLMAIVAQTKNERIYLSPTEAHERIAENIEPSWVPTIEMATNPRHMTPPLYGMTTFADIFTKRQLVALTTFSELIQVVRTKILFDAQSTGVTDDGVPLCKGGNKATAYADALAIYLAFAIDKYAMYGCTLVPWYPQEDRTNFMFGRQALSMVWDYTEINPFTDLGGSLQRSIDIVAESVSAITNQSVGFAVQQDATSGMITDRAVISTDPPYYDNVPYADLSDYFYIWLRHSLREIYPELFDTLLVPKKEELVADPYRHGDKGKSETHFLEGMKRVVALLRKVNHPAYPATIYYAFKQTESKKDKDLKNSTLVSTGWETMLEALITTGFTITGTWPLRTERSGRLRDTDSNALASSVVLVCRSRSDSAPLTTRREFLNALRKELSISLQELQKWNIAPVDLAQASIGPGMAIFSRYSKVIEADGSAMRVRTALALINQALDEYLSEQEGEYDSDTRWALAWFEQYAFNEGPFGDAETLSKAKNTSVGGMVQAGILSAGGGKVRLLRREELPADWDPAKDRRVTVWEITQYLIRVMQEKGEAQAAILLNQVGDKGEIARDLAYRLYAICERKGWAQEALPYNSLVVAWSDVGRMAMDVQKQPVQGRLI